MEGKKVSPFFLEYRSARVLLSTFFSRLGHLLKQRYNQRRVFAFLRGRILLPPFFAKMGQTSVFLSGWASLAANQISFGQQSKEITLFADPAARFSAQWMFKACFKIHLGGFLTRVTCQ